MKRRWRAGVRKSLYGRIRCAGEGEVALEAGLGARRALVVVWVVAMTAISRREGQWWFMLVALVLKCC